MEVCGSGKYIVMDGYTLIYSFECHLNVINMSDFLKKKVFLQKLPDAENIIQLSHWKQV